MNTDLVYGFLDESPSLHDKAFFFCVGIILASDPDEKRYRSLFKRVKEKTRDKKLRKISEIKFSEVSEQMRKRVLLSICKLPIKAVVFVANTEGRRVTETPENYGIVIGFSIVEVLKLYPAVILTVDKKFTNPKQQEEVEKVALKVVSKQVKKGILDFKSHTESHKNSLLRMADFIAGAFNYKYNLKDDTYWKLIDNVIIKEKVKSWPKMKGSTKKE